MKEETFSVFRAPDKFNRNMIMTDVDINYVYTSMINNILDTFVYIWKCSGMDLAHPSYAAPPGTVIKRPSRRQILASDAAKRPPRPPIPVAEETRRPSSPRRRVWSLLLEPKLLHRLQEWHHGLPLPQFPLEKKRRNHRPWSRGTVAWPAHIWPWSKVMTLYKCPFLYIGKGRRPCRLELVDLYAHSPSTRRSRQWRDYQFAKIVLNCQTLILAITTFCLAYPLGWQEA